MVFPATEVNTDRIESSPPHDAIFSDRLADLAAAGHRARILWSRSSRLAYADTKCLSPTRRRTASSDSQGSRSNSSCGPPPIRNLMILTIPS